MADIQFEFDPAKSEANLAKHGIDFTTAQRLWADDNRICVDALFLSEERALLIGRIDEKHWTAVFTMRNGTIRIISVRRARVVEMNAYESDNPAR
jgi:hypothetical protein